MRSTVCSSRTIRYGSGHPMLAAILNLSPDSFSGDGASDWRPRADALIRSGVCWIDVGAESTRPGSSGVDPDHERALLIPAIRYIREQAPEIIISADTRHASVARAAAEAGADILNDVSGLGDPAMLRTVAETGCGFVLMHSRGTPETMQSKENLKYADVTEDVCSFFEEQLRRLENAGVPRSAVLLDPGIGFAKNTEQNLTLIRNADVFHRRFDLPLFYGVSRKRFIGELTGETDASKRDAGTAGVLLYLADLGTEVLRVHNVKTASDALCMYEMLKKN